MRVLGLSIITDMCLPDSLEPASLDAILAVARGAEPHLTTLVRGVLERHVTSTGAAGDRGALSPAPAGAGRARDGGGAARALAVRGPLPPHARGARGRGRVRVLRGAADGERPPGHPSRLLAHAEGPLLPSSRDAGIPRLAQGGLGHARPAGGDRGREGARHQRQAGHRAPRRRGVQPPLPRERVEVSRGVGEAQRADGVLARLREPVRHLLERVRRERVVGAEDAATSGACCTQGHKILPYCPRCGTSLSSHEVAQGYEDTEDPSIYLALDLERARRAGRARSPASSCGRRRRGRCFECRAGRESRAHVHRGPQERPHRLDAAARGIARDRRARDRSGAPSGRSSRSSRADQLAGLRYARPLDWVPYGEGAHEVIVAEDFVSADDGSRRGAHVTRRSARTTTRPGRSTGSRSCSR